MSQPLAKDLTQAMMGVLFLAPAHFGDNSAAWGAFGAQITRVLSIDFTLDQIQQFQNVNSQFNDWLDKHRRKRHGRSKVFVLYEKLPVEYSQLVGEPVCIIDPCSTPLINHMQVVPLTSVDLTSSRYEQIQSDFKGMTESNDQNKQNLTRIVNMVKQLSANGTQAVNSLDGREFVLECFDVTEDMKLAIILADLGQDKKAEETCARVIEDFKPHDDLQMRLFYQEQYAKLERSRGYYENAYKLGEEVFHARRTRYSYDEASLLYSAGQLSLTLSCQNKFQEAFSVIRQSYEAYETEPFDTMRSTQVMGIYSRICQDTGDYRLAELISRNVLSASQKHLKAGHQVISVCKVYVSDALACSGNILAAKRFSEEAFQTIIRAQGKSHPNAILASETLANCYRYTNKLDSASELLEDLISSFTRNGFRNTPRALKIRSYLAAVYGMQGYSGECEFMLRYIVKEQEKIFGHDHLDSRWTAEALQQIHTLLKDKSINDTTWMTANNPACHKARELLMSPRRLCKEIQRTSVEQFWPVPEISQLIEFYGSNQQEKFVETLKTFDKPVLLGGLLRLAAARNNGSLVVALLDHGVPVDSKGGFYGTALQAACASRLYGLASTLLQRKADANSTGGIFGSPLRAAVFTGEEKLVRLLLDWGAKPCFGDESDCNPHHPMSPLQIAIAFGHNEIAQLLLQKEPQLAKLSDSTYNDPLQEACAKGQLRIVKVLLENGAKIKSTGGIFGSPLEAARQNNYPDIIAELEARITTPVPTEISQHDSMLAGTHTPPTIERLYSNVGSPGLVKTETSSSSVLKTKDSTLRSRIKTRHPGPLRKKLVERSRNLLHRLQGTS